VDESLALPIHLVPEDSFCLIYARLALLVSQIVTYPSADFICWDLFRSRSQ
jgi:hypothetical protein